jgi:hypothetical protein
VSLQGTVGGVRWVRKGVGVHQANFPSLISWVAQAGSRVGAQDARGNESSHLLSQKPEEDPGTPSGLGVPQDPFPQAGGDTGSLR